jgi:hypothetical protein
MLLGSLSTNRQATSIAGVAQQLRTSSSYCNEQVADPQRSFATKLPAKILDEASDKDGGRNCYNI